MRRTIVVLAVTVLVAIGASVGPQAVASTHFLPIRDGARGAHPLADSVKGFSGTQGKKGWNYGYYADPPSPTFTVMTQYSKKSPPSGCSSKVWYEECATYFTLISKKYMHPESVNTSGGRVPTNQWAVRRWISSSATNVSIVGKLAKSNTACGDGVGGHILVDGHEVWSGQVSANDAKGINFSVPTAVSIGSTVDFALDPLDSDLCDGSFFTAKIYAS